MAGMETTSRAKTAAHVGRRLGSRRALRNGSPHGGKGKPTHAPANRGTWPRGRRPKDQPWRPIVKKLEAQELPLTDIQSAECYHHQGRIVLILDGRAFALLPGPACELAFRICAELDELEGA